MLTQTNEKVFDTYEEDGIYLIPKHFVIPAYMFDDQYLDYHIENDQDVVVDQSKTYAEKAAKILRRSRRSVLNCFLYSLFKLWMLMLSLTIVLE